MVRIPDAGDFAQGPSARDPGLTVPASPFGRGLENIGRQIGALAERRQAQDVEQERAAQAFRQKQQEAEDLRYFYDYKAALQTRTAERMQSFAGQQTSPTYAEDVGKAMDTVRTELDSEFAKNYRPSPGTLQTTQALAVEARTAKYIGALADSQNARAEAAVLSATDYGKSLSRVAYEGPSADVVVGALAEIDQVAGDMLGAVDPDKREEWLSGRKEAIVKSFYLGKLRQDGVDETERALNDREFVNLLSPQAEDDIREAIENERARENNRRAADLERQTKAAENALERMLDVAKQGSIASNAEFEATVEGLPPEIADSLRARSASIRQASRNNRDLNQLSVPQLATLEDSIRTRLMTGAYTKDELEYEKARLSIVTKAREAWMEDPTAHAIAMGLANPPPTGGELSLDDPEYRAWSQYTADVVASRTGPESRVFDDVALDTLRSSFKTGGVSEIKSSLSYLAGVGLVARAAAAEHLGRDMGPTARVAVGLVGIPGKQDVAADIIRGQQILSDPGPKAFTLPAVDVMQGAMKKVFGDAFAGNNAAATELMQAALALYAARGPLGATAKGASYREGGSEAATAAALIREVSPVAPAELNGSSVLIDLNRVKKYGMPEDDASDLGSTVKSKMFALRDGSGGTPTEPVGSVMGAVIVPRREDDQLDAGSPSAASRAPDEIDVVNQMAVLPAAYGAARITAVRDAGGNPVPFDDLAAMPWELVDDDAGLYQPLANGGSVYVTVQKADGTEFPDVLILSVDRIMEAQPLRRTPRRELTERGMVRVVEPLMPPSPYRIQSGTAFERFQQRNAERMSRSEARAREIDQNLRGLTDNSPQERAPLLEGARSGIFKGASRAPEGRELEERTYDPRRHADLELRPLEREYVDNFDSTYSTERLVAAPLTGDPNGEWVVAPSLWAAGDLAYTVEGDDQIVEIVRKFENRTGKKFPRFATQNAAVEFSRSRSGQGGTSAGNLAK